MIRRLLAGLLIFGAILSACDHPGPPHPDWCYVFDFTAQSYGFGLAYGSWTPGTGFQSDSSGRLALSYVYDGPTVAPEVVIVNVARASGSTGSINVEANALVFGIAIGGSSTLPEDTDSASLPFQKQASTDTGVTVNGSLQSSAPVDLQSIEVQGDGVDPFPSNSCSPITLTPATATSVLITDTPTNTTTPPATSTPAPTNTPPPSDTPAPTTTPTITLTPSPTSTACDSDHTAVIDFDGTSDLAYVIYPTYGAIGAGGHSGDGLIGTTIDDGSFYASYNLITIYIDPSWTIKTYSYYYRYINTDDLGSDQYDGWGTDRSTASSHWFDNGRASAGGPTDWTVFTETINISGVNYLNLADSLNSHSSSTQASLDDITITYDDACLPPTPTPSITPTPTATAPTATPTTTLTPSITPSWLLSPSPTFTPLLIIDPPPATGTPTALPTHIAIYTLPPLATLPPAGTPFGPTSTATNWTGTPMITSTEGPTEIGGDIGTPDSSALGVGEIGGSALAFLTNIMPRAFNYLDQMAALASGTIDAYQNAQPEAIPEMPQCVSNRFASEVCAIWYILDYTLFAGQVGSLIIPLGNIDLGILIVFTTIQTIRAIIVRLKEIIKSQ